MKKNRVEKNELNINSVFLVKEKTELKKNQVEPVTLHVTLNSVLDSFFGKGKKQVEKKLS